MQEFKSPISRLVRLFRNGRDNWKEKALEKQKKLRALEIKVRDLSTSRENWKNRALIAESKLSQQNLEEGRKQKKGKSNPLNQTES